MIQKATAVEFGRRDRSTDNIYDALINRIHASTKDMVQIDVPRAIRIGITSCDHGDGVSTCALNLARYSAEVLKMEVLLVDASFGSTNAIQDENVENGLRQVLAHDADLDSTVQKSEVKHLDFLSGGSGAQYAFSHISLAELPEILKKLDQRYQIVIFDLPPVGGMVSGIPIASQLDGVILVIQPGSTKKDRAKAVSLYLRQSGVKVIGALANQAQTDLPPLPQLIWDVCKEVIAYPISMLRFVFHFVRRQK